MAGPRHAGAVSALAREAACCLPPRARQVVRGAWAVLPAGRMHAGTAAMACGRPPGVHTRDRRGRPAALTARLREAGVRWDRIGRRRVGLAAGTWALPPAATREAGGPVPTGEAVRLRPRGRRVSGCGAPWLRLRVPGRALVW
ncbi:hypothetical protein Acsp04_09250 [Actinomadura sp. NBRC 104425]|nr:hypothetical protein Acsp04_09250 [Actinomadura sp. NBRC 104425]